GFTALLLTLAGYWIGRYGETTGRDRAHAPVLSVAVVTFLYQVAALVMHFMLGDHAPACLVFKSLVPTILLNLILTFPVYALARRVLRPREWVGREVRLLGEEAGDSAPLHDALAGRRGALPADAEARASRRHAQHGCGRDLRSPLP